MAKKNVYFVGNAHLDPIWIWKWQEGSQEAKATIRSALDRMKEYPEFVFTCGQARVFEWVEEFAPEMFEEMKQRVKEGRLHIVGGQYVQPDCNNPSGESFARHSLYSQRYFKEKFGVTATCGYNVDSFGHNGNLPQILKKSGMDRYIFMRPGELEKELPTHVFYWEAPDGSKVLASRLTRMYSTTALGRMLRDGTCTEKEYFQKEINEAVEKSDPKYDEALFFFGVGNHGGGPTKRNIEMIQELRAEYPDMNFIFAQPDRYFDDILAHEKEQIITIKDDLQHHASGCYSTLTWVKNGIRRAECALTSAENATMLAATLGVSKQPDTKEFEALWKPVMFSHFHDSMGGCSIRAGHEGADRGCTYARYGAEVLENKAIQRIGWNVDTSDTEKGSPIFLYNPNPFPVETTIVMNKRVQHVYAPDGTEVAVQIVHSPSARVNSVVGDSIFKASVPALGYAVYTWKRNADFNDEPEFFETICTAHDNVLENDVIRVSFDRKSGQIISVYDKKTGAQYLRGNGAIPVVIDEREHDTWSHAKNFFEQEVGIFGNATVRALESGPVRAKMKVVSHYGASHLTQEFILTPGSREIEVHASVDWREARKMLKLRYECALEDPKAYYEIPFSVMERPADGEEEPGLMWVAARDEKQGFAILNDNKYSFSVKNNAMNLTAVRSPYYCDHGRGDQFDPECELTDQGISEFKYVFKVLEKDTPLHEITKRAKVLNTPPVFGYESWHEGNLPTELGGLTCSKENVLVSAIKRAEDGTGLVVRVYETDGVDTQFSLSGKMLPVALDAQIGHFAVDTYYLKDGDTTWKKVLMTEWE